VDGAGDELVLGQVAEAEALAGLEDDAGGTDELADTTTRSVPLMMKVPFSVIMGKSPMKTVCSLISPVLLLTNGRARRSAPSRSCPSLCTPPR
jgi:hypothetical protein